MKKSAESNIWINVMESLVAGEVERQLRQLSAKRQSFLQPEAIVTYALNRLKPLYANSTRGWEMQHQRAEQQFKAEIVTAVRQGIIAVERDPLRVSQPLKPKPDAKAEQALERLRQLLQCRELDWETLPEAVERALNAASTGQQSSSPTMPSATMPSATQRYGLRSDSHPKGRSLLSR